MDTKYNNTYPPAEDTYLLLKAAKQEARRDDMVLEIGCGRGLISEEIALHVKNAIATDLNPYAVAEAKNRGVEVIMADLFKGIRGRFDLVIFNPPYLPTSNAERSDDWMNVALDGGSTGRDVIARFIESLEGHLTEHGRSLLLISSLTGKVEVEDLARSFRFNVEEVDHKKVFFETLYVLRLKRSRESNTN